MDTAMEGADVDGLERAGRRCLDAAAVADQVRQLMQGIVAALSALSFFAGPWVAPLIAYLTTTVIPWLRNVADALRNFGEVLSGRAAAQRRISAGLPIDIARLPTYRGLTPIGAPGPADPSGPDPARPAPSGSATPPAEPLRPVPPATAAPRAPRGGGGGGGGNSHAAAPPLPVGGTAVPVPATAATVTPGALPPGEQPPAAPGAVHPTVRGGLSPGVVAGLAAAGGGLLGGGATYAAMRRRRDDTDGSELLGSTTVDRDGEGVRRPGTLTAADLAGGTNAGAPVAGPTTRKGVPP